MFDDDLVIGASAVALPKNGLYRTGMALRGSEETVPQGRLVLFLRESDQGPPIILLPEKQVFNRWRFKKNGHLVEHENYLEELRPLKPEGFYIFTEEFMLNDVQLVAKNQLAQLGYNTEAEPVVYFPKFDADTNLLKVPVKGLEISEEGYELLEQVDLRGPFDPPVPLFPAGL